MNKPIENNIPQFTSLGPQAFKYLLQFLNNQQIAMFALTCKKANEFVHANNGLYKLVRTMPLREYTAPHTLTKTKIKIPFAECAETTVFRYTNGNTLICRPNGIMRFETGNKKTSFEQATDQGIVKQIYPLNDTTFACSTETKDLHFWSMTESGQFKHIYRLNFARFYLLFKIVLSTKHIATCVFQHGKLVSLDLNAGKVITFKPQNADSNETMQANTVAFWFRTLPPTLRLRDVDLSTHQEHEEGGPGHSIKAVSLCSDDSVYLQFKVHDIVRRISENIDIKINPLTLDFKIENYQIRPSRCYEMMFANNSISINNFGLTLHMSIPQYRTSLTLQESELNQPENVNLFPSLKNLSISKNMLTQNGQVSFFMKVPLNKKTGVLAIAEFPERTPELQPL